MWILKRLDGGEMYYLPTGKEYVVGRKNCDILLSNDQSISRAHATLTATTLILTVKDSSKYGTFVGEQRLAENTSQSLKPGDRLTFGVFQSKFSVDKAPPLVVCSSCVDSAGKTRLSAALLPLGGKLVNSWTHDCTHLVMPTVKVTIKTISALLCCRPIVKQEFVSELSAAVEQKRPIPEARSFLPELDEPSLIGEKVDLTARQERKRLFHGKTFIFLSSKQHKRLSAAVSFGGGRSQLLTEGERPRALLQSPNSCVVDAVSGNSQANDLSSITIRWANGVNSLLHENGLRMIPESEIGLAAIYISCDKYCNPTFGVTVTAGHHPASSRPSRIPSATLSQNAVEETVLPGESMNITAYAANTEPSQGRCKEEQEEMGVTAVGETPERRQGARGGSLTTVAETLGSSLGSTRGASSQVQQPLPSPRKRGRPPKNPSPQKQCSLTNFFQPVSKKRAREDDSSPVELESKRAMPDDDVVPVSRATRSSGSSLLFPDQSLSSEQQSRKRKEMEPVYAVPEEELEELGSFMDDDFEDDYDPLPNSQPAQQAQSAEHNGTSSADQSELSSKRPRLDPEESDSVPANQPALKVEEEEEELSVPNRNQSLEAEAELSPPNRNQSLETEEVPPASSANRSPRPQPEEDTASNRESERQHEQRQAAKEEEVSVLVDSEEVDARPKAPETPLKAPETPLAPPKVKLETPVSMVEDDLPQATVLIEFKSLTVAPPRAKPQHFQGNGGTTNFKRFRKVQLPGSAGRASIIGASDLLVYNRSTNAELDEWMRDVAEEEQRSKNDENMGDDLFRYNPSTIKRR